MSVQNSFLIPFNQTTIAGNELEYIAEVVQKGHLAGDGDFTKKCHQYLQDTLGPKKVLLTTSCTHALEMSAMLLDIQPGDEVIVPSFTFVTTANAFVMRGAKPVFVDIRPDTLNMDETKIEDLITEKTKAIVPVHYAGVGCEMDDICAIGAKYNIPIVEDNAHGLFGKYMGRFLGTFGTLATQSFHETKNFTCGEGGALLINDIQYADRAEIIREKGTNRSRFFRGQVDKYTWVDVGSSYLPSEILAAYLFGQLEAHESIQEKRRHIWHFYDNHFRNWAPGFGIGLPVVPSHCEQAYHLYYLLLPSLEQRQDLIAFLKTRGIQSVFHYLPLHLSDMGRKFGGKKRDCPVTEDISDRLLRLPFYNTLNDADLLKVIVTVQEYFSTQRILDLQQAHVPEAL